MTLWKEHDPQTRDGLVILGPYGNVWAPVLFQTPEQAVRYLRKHHPHVGRTDMGVEGLDQWRIAPGTMTIAVKQRPTVEYDLGQTVEEIENGTGKA